MFISTRSLASLCFAAIAGVACTDMPLMTQYQGGGRNQSVREQALAASARHWDSIGRDIADQILEHQPAPCAAVDWSGDTEAAIFQRAVAASVLTRLASKSGTIYTSPRPDCDRIVVESDLVRHGSAPPGSTFPGQYTALSAGLVVVRNVARAFSEASFIGLGVGADAYLRGVRPNGPFGSQDFAELIVTVSLTDGGAEPRAYKFRYTDVYYVATNDADLYLAKPKKRQPAVESSTSTKAGEEAHSTDPAVVAKPMERIVVDPSWIDTCVKEPGLIVFGSGLTVSPENYAIGQTTPSTVRRVSMGLNGVEAVRLSFSPTEVAVKVTADRMLSVLTHSGQINIPVVLIAGETGGCASLAAPKKPPIKRAVKAPVPGAAASVASHAPPPVTNATARPGLPAASAASKGS